MPKISGSVPVSLSSLSKLDTLNISALCKLSGSFPDLSMLGSLLNYVIMCTTLSGTLHTELAQLSLLTNLIIAQNQYLSGTLPTVLAQLSLLTNLIIADNTLLSGTLVSLDGLTDLVSFGVYANLVSGSLTQELGKLTKLVTLNVLGGGIVTQLVDDQGLCALPLLRQCYLNTLQCPLPKNCSSDCLRAQSFCGMSPTSFPSPAPSPTSSPASSTTSNSNTALIAGVASAVALVAIFVLLLSLCVAARYRLAKALEKSKWNDDNKRRNTLTRNPESQLAPDLCSLTSDTSGNETFPLSSFVRSSRTLSRAASGVRVSTCRSVSVLEPEFDSNKLPPVSLNY
jgi:hypothetical protein